MVQLVVQALLLGVEIGRDLGLLRQRQHVQHAVRAAAERVEHRDRVLEGPADRKPPACQQLHRSWWARVARAARITTS